jgi:hypothetical protein
MVDDHAELNQRLMNVVTRKRIRISEAIDARALLCAESLAGLPGARLTSTTPRYNW